MDAGGLTSGAVPALVGGVMIGAAAATLLVLTGRIAGISGIVAGSLRSHEADRAWRLTFLAGLLAGGAVLAVVHPTALPARAPVPFPTLALAGLLVGYGTRLGNGCTSGHGVCGIGRLSPRALAATATFMATGIATVFVVRHVLGGGA